MAFHQLYPENAGYVRPSSGGYSQLRDAQNPQAIAYARQMLRAHGIPVPKGADPTALWRQFSQHLADAREAALANTEASPESPMTPGMIPPSPRPIDLGFALRPDGRGPGGGPVLPLPIDRFPTGQPNVVPRGTYTPPSGGPTAPSRSDLIRAILASRSGLMRAE